MNQHIATLKEVVTEATGEQRRVEADDLRLRLDQAVAELVEMSRRMIEQTAAKDQVQADLEAYRSRSWWRRMVG